MMILWIVVVVVPRLAFNRRVTLLLLWLAMVTNSVVGKPFLRTMNRKQKLQP
jgi:hypothetical protein